MHQYKLDRAVVQYIRDKLHGKFVEKWLTKPETNKHGLELDGHGQFDMLEDDSMMEEDDDRCLHLRTRLMEQQTTHLDFPAEVAFEVLSSYELGETDSDILYRKQGCK